MTDPEDRYEQREDHAREREQDAYEAMLEAKRATPQPRPRQ